MDAALAQHGEGVARAVADREHDALRLQIAAAMEVQAAHPALAARVALYVDPVDAGAEAVLPAQLLDRRAHALDHRHETKRADMRVRLGQDLGRRAGLHELAQHVAVEVARVLDAAVELAVGEGASTTLAELDVGFGVEHAAPPQPPRVLGPLAHDLPALEDDRAEPHLREDQPGEQSARPRADHHRARRIRRGGGDVAIAGVGRALDVAILAQPREHLRLVAQRDVDRVDERDVRLVARIMPATHDLVAHEIARRHPQPLDDRSGDRFVGVMQREGQVGQAQHRGPT